MFENMNTITIITAYMGISSKHATFQNRASHVFIYKINGESEYTFDNVRITLSKGELLYIPKGKSYSVKKTCSIESNYALINFDMVGTEFEQKKYTLENSSDIRFIFERIIHLWLFQNAQNRFLSLSLFYKLLSLIVASERQIYYHSNQTNIIEPAITYLENHIFDSSLSVKSLHSLCNITDTYFRKIFISVFGVSPKKYVINKRMMQAKTLIDNGDYTYLYHVSEFVGYNDPLYFSKVFKQYYGYLPSENNEQRRNLR